MTGELGVRIVTEIARREAVDPTSLTPPLHDVVNTDALEALFEPTTTTARDGTGAVSFTYLDYEVTITTTGDIRVQNVLETPTASETTCETAIE